MGNQSFVENKFEGARNFNCLGAHQCLIRHYIALTQFNYLIFISENSEKIIEQSKSNLLHYNLILKIIHFDKNDSQKRHEPFLSLAPTEFILYNNSNLNALLYIFKMFY